MTTYQRRGDHRGTGLTRLMLLATAAAAWGAAAAQAQTASYHIPAGALAEAINTLAEQSGAQIVYDGALASGRQVPALDGRFDAADALSRLLAGSGLTYRRTGERSFTLERLPQTGDDGVQLGALRVEASPATGRNAQAAAPQQTGVRAAADRPYRSPGASDYISREQIARVPVTSTGDLFKLAAGVISSGNRNGDSVDINIRGMQGYNRVAMLVDGAPSDSSDYRGYNGSRSRLSVDPAFLAGIAIDKGPSGGPGGAGYSAGAVDARTLTAHDVLRPGRIFGLRVQAGLGDNAASPPPPPDGWKTYSREETPDDWHDRHPGTTDRPGFLTSRRFQGNVVAAWATERFELLAGYAHTANGNYFSGRHGNGYDRVVGQAGYPSHYADAAYAPGYQVYNTSRYADSVLLKAGATVGAHTLKLSYMLYDSRFGEHDSESVMPNASPDYPVMPTEQPPMTIHSDTVTARYTLAPADGAVNLHLDLWSVAKKERFWNDEKAGLFSDDPIPQYFRQHNIGGALYNDWHAAGGWGDLNVRAGLSYAAERGRNDPIECDSTRSEESKDDPFCHARKSFLNPEGTRDIFSVYAQTRYTPVRWLILNGDLRYDTYHIAAVDPRNDRDGRRLNPKAAITIEPVTGVQLFAQQAYGWRPPSLREMTMTFNVTPNPDLRPECVDNREYGINLLRDTLFGRPVSLRAKLSYFDNQTRDYVIRIRPRRGAKTWSNIDAARHRGWDASVKIDAGRVFGDLAYMRYDEIVYCQTPDGCKADVNRFAGLPTDYQANYVPPRDNGSVTIGGRLLRERALTIGARADFNGAIFFETGENGARQTRPQTIWSSFVNWRQSDRLDLNLSGENLTDEYYYDPMIVGRVPSPGRTIKATVTLHL